MNLDTLDAFAPGVKKKGREKPPPVYSLPIAESAFVLAFDQTLGHTGWALLHAVQIDKCWVRAHEVGDIKQDPDPALQGFAADDDQVRRLARRIDEVLDHAQQAAGLQGCSLYVVREMPAVRGPRSTSSVRAAAVVDAVCALRNVPTRAVNSQHVKTVLTGKRDTSKAEVKVAVQGRLPETTNMRPMNANVSDALAIGLTWLLDNP